MLKLTMGSEASAARSSGGGLELIGWMVAEGSEQAGAEAILQPGVVGMMLVEAPLDAEQAFAEPADDLPESRVGLAWRVGRASLR